MEYSNGRPKFTMETRPNLLNARVGTRGKLNAREERFDQKDDAEEANSNFKDAAEEGKNKLFIFVFLKGFRIIMEARCKVFMTCMGLHGFDGEHSLRLANLLECSTVPGLKVVVRKELQFSVVAAHQSLDEYYIDCLGLTLPLSHNLAKTVILDLAVEIGLLYRFADAYDEFTGKSFKQNIPGYDELDYYIDSLMHMMNWTTVFLSICFNQRLQLQSEVYSKNVEQWWDCKRMIKFLEVARPANLK
ncbi:hypothetical protein C5167_026198 [Papaver somniferum]|nr:hypothetical protein C5167_026198 [Papaver somniferum]